jgi:hypothetical protein
MVILYILWLYCIYYGYTVYIMVILYIFWLYCIYYGYTVYINEWMTLYFLQPNCWCTSSSNISWHFQPWRKWHSSSNAWLRRSRYHTRTFARFMVDYENEWMNEWMTLYFLQRYEDLQSKIKYQNKATYLHNIHEVVHERDQQVYG